MLMSRRASGILIAAGWVVAFVLALAFDGPIARTVRDSGADAWLHGHKLLAEILKTPGTFPFTAAVILLVLFVHPLQWRAAGFVLLATVISGVNGLIKWLVGRTRPFKLGLPPRLAPFELSPLRGGLGGLFVSKNLCFPSGHAALAFATAAALAMLWSHRRWRWGFYAVAAIVAAERVLENAHWLSDTVAGAALGVGGVHLIRWLLVKWLVEPHERGVILDAH
jgi:membrane-associated phospholipid phosphatase